MLTAYLDKCQGMGCVAHAHSEWPQFSLRFHDRQIRLEREYRLLLEATASHCRDRHAQS